MTTKFADIFVPGANIDYALDEMVTNSFFLPNEVRDELEARGWRIQQIKVVPNEDFWESVDYITRHADVVKYLPSMPLVADAKYVGISVRTNKDVSVVICKMWNKDGDEATGVDNGKL